MKTRIALALLIALLSQVAFAQGSNWQPPRTVEQQIDQLRAEIELLKRRLPPAPAVPLVGSCWSCMHGCTPEQNREICGPGPR